jgi:WD40 repeat protein
LKNRVPLANPLYEHSGTVLDVVFSPDGRWLASSSGDRTIALHDMQRSNVSPTMLEGHTDSVLRIAFSPDSRLLASAADDASIRLWDLTRTPPVSRRLLGHAFYASAVAFSPDGRQLASGGGDGTVRLWDPASAAPFPEPLRAHQGVVWTLAFSPDGRTLLSGGSGKDGGALVFWDLNVDHWIAWAREMANRELTREEVTQYFGDFPCQPLGIAPGSGLRTAR